MVERVITLMESVNLFQMSAVFKWRVCGAASPLCYDECTWLYPVSSHASYNLRRNQSSM